jgi:hypothetical protein
MRPRESAPANLQLVGAAAGPDAVAGYGTGARRRTCASSGPAYGFFGLGLCLYFASQGAGRLAWPLLAGLLRLVLAVGGGWLALRLTGSLSWVFVALSVALVAYGSVLLAAIGAGVWWRRPRSPLAGGGRAVALQPRRA